MEILTHQKIEQKIRRLAIEIMERNTEEQELFVAGVNNNGLRFATLIVEELKKLSSCPIHLLRMQLDPAHPIEAQIELDMPIQNLSNKAILIVDDVANTGRTLFYACKPLLEILPKKIEVAVLVDRTHKSFPIHADYVGLSLATTLREHIQVNLSEADAYSASLN